MAEVDKIVLYLMPHKIQKRRYDDMKKAAMNRKFNIFDTFRGETTHIITEFETKEQALRHLELSDTSGHSVEILNTSWFTESIRAKKPVHIEERHKLRSAGPDAEANSIETPPENRIPEWACQRSTPLKHHNHFLSSKLELLQRNHELIDGPNDYSRALAYRRASCVVKALPFKVTNVNQVNNIRDMGPHSKQVIEELLDGYCEDVDKIQRDDWFKKMEMFTSIFGVGPSTAKDWIQKGWTTVKDAQESTDRRKDWRIEWGLAFHDDLTDLVNQEEGERFTSIIKTEAEKVLPGVIVQLTGGFRRGKKFGHDIDILFTHQNEGEELEFLPKLLKRLEKLNLILGGSHEKSTFHERVLTEDFKLSMRGQLDHFEKWIGICKLPKNLTSDTNLAKPSAIGCEKLSSKEDLASLDDYEPKTKKQRTSFNGSEPFVMASSERDWIARRVDLIVSPYSQYYYALVGWTGSKQFNRDLRLYSQRVLNSKLTSHGLYDFKKSKKIPANSEREVFENLNIPYQDPEHRNC